MADRELVGLLGSGGEGEVWEAVRPDRTRCALKLIKPTVLPAPDEVRRRGAWLVRIDHPALVRVTRGGRFTAGSLAGWGFVEMDLIAGPSLQDVAPIPDALKRLEGVAEALDLLHAGAWSHGVPLVHRDVKQGNLLAAGEGLVLVDPSTMRGLDSGDLTRVGTPAYVAPEVLTGRFGPLADVYSLAATAAALMTGKRGTQLSRVLADPRAHGLPASICAALHVDPSRRPGTCAAVIEGRRVADVPVLGTQPTADGPWASQQGLGHRAGPLWALLALALITLAPAVAWSVAQTRPSVVAPDLMIGIGAAGLAAHVVIHLFTGRGMLGVLAPPWAWGDLLAGRSGWFGKRVVWLADVSAGTILAGVAGVVFSIVSSQPPQVVPFVTGVSVLLLGTWRRLARVSGRVRWAPIWTLTLPLRLLGSVPRVLISGRR
ncbi:hypothetical protein BH24ACT15_BH24ACT15_26920 [soil metagenome]